jgi:hypothetical protein
MGMSRPRRNVVNRSDRVQLDRMVLGARAAARSCSSKDTGRSTSVPSLTLDLSAVMVCLAPRSRNGELLKRCARAPYGLHQRGAGYLELYR